MIDPGIGFGKTLEHNLVILKRLGELKTLRCPITIGVSRKSFIGEILKKGVKGRLMGTAAACAVAIASGADVIRVHDTSEMAEVAKVVDAIIKRSA
jgi:dihydropteroate synthase